MLHRRQAIRVEERIKENLENSCHEDKRSSDVLDKLNFVLGRWPRFVTGENAPTLLVAYRNVKRSRNVFIGGVKDEIEEPHLLCIMKSLMEVVFDSTGD